MPLCRDEEEPAPKAMDRFVGEGDSDEESGPLFPVSTAGGVSAGVSSVLIARGVGGGALGLGLGCGVSSEAEAAARAALSAKVFAFGGRPLPLSLIHI